MKKSRIASADRTFDKEFFPVSGAHGMVEKLTIPLVTFRAAGDTMSGRRGIGEGFHLIPMAGGTGKGGMNTFQANLVTEEAVFPGKATGRAKSQ